MVVIVLGSVEEIEESERTATLACNAGGRALAPGAAGFVRYKTAIRKLALNGGVDVSHRKLESETGTVRVAPKPCSLPTDVVNDKGRYHSLKDSGRDDVR